MIKIRKNNPAFVFLMNYWKKHCILENSHYLWIQNHIEIKSKISKNTAIHLYGERSKVVYFVCKGALARIHYDKNYKLHIDHIALPGMALMSTIHIYSNTLSEGDIISIQPNSSYIIIKYKDIHQGIQHSPELETLINIFSNKIKKQIIALNVILHESTPLERYCRFINLLPELHQLLTQSEQSSLLNISRRTIQRIQYGFLKGNKI
ncbi:Crp/Fnr family transcriptional regulator [Sphingobacterium bovisgrunnientis]|uniref:Crp/Fnr family transcriptional regulator n=1 Tax=Sphingobacterium bovisgrunnientis TaxID=1874697 RepID=UPI001359BFE0|nr:hypothetical protein [Sphingobacterium bovisgrunnientis]